MHHGDIDLILDRAMKGQISRDGLGKCLGPPEFTVPTSTSNALSLLIGGRLPTLGSTAF
jgi:hypothetical protein